MFTPFPKVLSLNWWHCSRLSSCLGLFLTSYSWHVPLFLWSGSFWIHQKYIRISHIKKTKQNMKFSPPSICSIEGKPPTLSFLILTEREVSNPYLYVTTSFEWFLNLGLDFRPTAPLIQTYKSGSFFNSIDICTTYLLTHSFHGYTSRTPT